MQSITRNDRAPICSLAICVLGLIPFLLLGCSNKDSWMADTFETAGTVTINGQPAEHAIVMLHYKGDPPDKRKSVPFGRVDANGTFRLMTYQPNDGAPAGEYAVTVLWPSNPKSPTFDRLGSRYADPENPVLIVTIPTQNRELPPIRIENAKVSPSIPSVP